jgi:hypothetical protein
MATFECWAGIQPRFGSFPINISFLGDIYHTNFVKNSEAESSNIALNNLIII